MAAHTKRLRVLVACSGVGHVMRGYEAASVDLAAVLGDVADVTLARGGGQWWGDGGVRLPCLQRNGKIASDGLHLTGEAAYVWEQRSFALSAYTLARLGGFDIVHLHDPALTNAFWHARRLIGGKFTIVFTNSGPMSAEHLRRPDVVQSVTPIDEALLIDAGFAPERRAMVPYGISPTEPVARTFAEGPPRTIVGVGALNDTHKGFLTAISAVAGLSGASLRLLGQRDAETPSLEAFGREKLGARFSAETLPRARVGEALAAADAFVLPSHGEGFCIAVLEALEAGIPCVVSDIPILRWLVGDAAVLVPPDRPDEWTTALTALTAERRRELSARGRARAREFHWSRLVPSYLAMYERAIVGPGRPR